MGGTRSKKISCSSQSLDIKPSCAEIGKVDIVATVCAATVHMDSVSYESENPSH